MVAAMTRKDSQGTPLVEGATVMFHTTPTHKQEGIVREVRFDDCLVDSGKITWTLPHRLVTVKTDRPWYENAGVVTAREHQDWKLRHWALTETIKSWRERELSLLRDLRVWFESGMVPPAGLLDTAGHAREACETIERLEGELSELCGGRS